MLAAQCRVIGPKKRWIAAELVGAAPPGPRGTPPSRCWHNGVSILHGVNRPTRASAADLGVRPTIAVGMVPGIQNQVALGRQPERRLAIAAIRCKHGSCRRRPTPPTSR